MATPRPLSNSTGSVIVQHSASEGMLTSLPRQPPLKKSMTAPIDVETPESFIQRFVPDMVVERLFNGGAIQSQELSRYQQSVVGFFDVSGFSSLARDLEQADRANSEKAMKRRSAVSIISQHSISGKGAEELVRQLNETLSALIDTIRNAGGDIIKFAGDAILVVWLCSELEPMDTQLLRAVECAVQCTTLKSDQSKLGLHVGIGCGELVACHVGGTFGRWEFFIAGEACTQSALAEHHAGTNQVVISPQCKEILNSSKYLRLLGGTEVNEGFYLVTKVQFQNLGPPPKSQYFLSSDAKVAKAAEGYIPGPVRDALKNGGNSNAAVGGLRKLTVIFFKLYDVVLPSKFDQESEKKFLEQCQNQAKLVQDSAYHYYATLRQFILDDKGFVAIVAVGLPPFFHEDNAVRAVKVAKRLIEHHKIRATAGICTGTVFCGVVGSSKRAEYSVAGSCINLAARLMAQASPGSIWCDATTKSEAESVGYIRFEQFPSLPFKGFHQPVEIYGPIMSTAATTPGPKPNSGSSIALTAAAGQNQPSVDNSRPPAPEILNRDGASGNSKTPPPGGMSSGYKLEREDSYTQRSRRRNRVSEPGPKRSVAIVGAEKEQEMMSRAAFIGSSPPVRVCFAEGEAGSGKTKLVEWVLKETGAKTSILATADSSETNTPFFVWRTILQSILAVTRPTKQSSFLDMSTNRAKEKMMATTTTNLLSRKRGYSAEEGSSTLQQPPPPPILTHRRNVSIDRVSLTGTSTSLFPSTSSSIPPPPFAGHHRSQSNTSVKSVDLSPLKKETTSSQARSTRGESIFAEIAAQPTTEEGEEEEDHNNTSSEDEDDDHGGLGGKTKQIGDKGMRQQSTSTVDDEPLVAHPPTTTSVGVLSRMSMDASSNSPSSTTKRFPFLGQQVGAGAYVPENSLVLERLLESGRLRGKRLSCLHAIIPNLVIPLIEEDTVPPTSNDAQSTTNASASAALPSSSLPQSAISAASLLAARLGTPQRRTSFSTKGFTSPAGNPTAGTSSTTTGGGSAAASGASPVVSSTATDGRSPVLGLTPPVTIGNASSTSSSVTVAHEPVSEAQASTELMTLLLEECGNLGSTLIVIENAQFVDKPSWELLRKCCDMSPASWKGEHRVRFIVTFRPFLTPREHPLQMMLQGGLQSSSSMPNMSASSNNASTTTSTTSTPAQSFSIGNPAVINNNASVTSPSMITQTTPTHLQQQQQQPAQPPSQLLQPQPQQAANTTTDSIKIPPPPAFERVSSTLSAIAHHATSRRRSMEQVSLQGQFGMRASGGSEIRSEAAPPEDEPRAIKVIVNPLSAREAGVFLSNVHSVAIGPNLLKFLYKRARGNPRAMLECFQALQDQELIKVDFQAGTVEETTPLEEIGDMVFIIPMHLRAQLQQLIDKLKNRGQLILKLASIAGSSFSVALLRWVFVQRNLQNQEQQSLASMVDGGGFLDPQDEEARLNKGFNEGMKELWELGFMRPFLPLHEANEGPIRSSSDPDNGHTAEKLGDDDHWFFETEHIRFLVYSQTLHTMRCEVHGQVLDWYRLRPASHRKREDPVHLANHALGAEQPMVAFECFREGLKRVVFKGEQVSRGERLWQSCADLLDDPNTGFSANVVTAYRVVIDVLMGHVCIQNDSWDEGKVYFNRALEAAQLLLGDQQGQEFSRRKSFASSTGRSLFASCFPTKSQTSSSSSSPSSLTSERNTLEYPNEAYYAHERDPLAFVDFQPLQEAKTHAQIAKTCLKRIEELQKVQERMVQELKKFSLKETADHE